MKKENHRQQKGNVLAPVHNAVAAEVIPVAETAANSSLDSRVFSTRARVVSQAAMAALSVSGCGVGRGVGAAQLDVGVALGQGRSVAPESQRVHDARAVGWLEGADGVGTVHAQAVAPAPGSDALYTC